MYVCEDFFDCLDDVWMKYMFVYVENGKVKIDYRFNYYYIFDVEMDVISFKARVY